MDSKQITALEDEALQTKHADTHAKIEELRSSRAAQDEVKRLKRIKLLLKDEMDRRGLAPKRRKRKHRSRPVLVSA